MTFYEALEKRAMEALGKISLVDHLGDWQGKSNAQTVLAVNRIPNTVREKQKSFRISTCRGSNQQLKELFVPNKIKFEDHSLMQRCKRKSRHSSSDVKRKGSQKKQNKQNSYSSRQKPNVSSDKMDFLKFWFRHRNEQNSINSLIQKIKEKRQVLRKII